MSKAKFKTGDLVESIWRKEVLMINNVLPNQLEFVEFPNLYFPKGYYKKLNSKSVKFNLK